MVLTETYRRWNAALAAEYFRAEDAGRPTYLAVDDEELEELAAKVGVDRSHAVQDFINAVRHEVWRAGDPFRLMIRERITWRSTEDGLPPYVAVLGICVLAASRMARDADAGVWSNDYYSQLNPILGRERHGGRPPNFERLHLLWDDLTQWLERDLAGQRGTSTVQTHDVFRHIGYPISQCLLRANDRRVLPDFFRAVGLEPGDEVSGERLFAMLRAWARPGSSLTGHGQRVVASAAGSSEQALAEMLSREFAHWDGELRDERGRRRADIAVFAESLAGGRRIELRLYATRPDGFPDGPWVLPSGRTLELTSAGHGWYGRLPLKATAEHLREGLRLTSNGFALALEGADAIPMRASFLPEAGWLSARQATALEEHLVLVHATAEPALRAFLEQHAEPGWSLSRVPGDLPPGWLAARRVRISSPPNGVPPSLRRLVPRINTAMRLEGGLPLARRIGLYLRGGEPDLWVNIENPDGSSIRIDDADQQLKPGIAKFPLSALELEPGPHTVSAPGETRRFTSIETYGRPVPNGAETLGHVLERQSEYLPLSATAVEVGSEVPTGRIIICGAHVRGGTPDLPTSSYAPVVLRSGYTRYTLLGATPGDLDIVNPPVTPGWTTRLRPTPTMQFFEYSADYPIQLVIYEGAEGSKLRPAQREVASPLSRAHGDNSAAIDDWAHTIVSASDAGVQVPGQLAEVWDAYVQLALALASGA
jgi:hypothetical protein